VSYEPVNNGLRADLGLPYLDNGTTDPHKDIRIK